MFCFWKSRPVLFLAALLFSSGAQQFIFAEERPPVLDATNSTDSAVPQNISAELPPLSKALLQQLPEKLEGKPLVFIPRLSEAPKELKGDLSDPVWQHAATLNFVSNPSGSPVKFKTNARLFSSKEALYIGVQFEDPDTAHFKLEGARWERDGLEFFLEPQEDLKLKMYHQVLLDAANKSETARLHIYPHHKNRQINELWSPKFQSATAKTKNSWSAEFCIPFDDLPLSHNNDQGKLLWRLDLFRFRPERGSEMAQNYAWAPTLADSHHYSARFGFAVLEGFANDALLKEIIARKVQELSASSALSSAALPDEAQKKEMASLIVKLGDDNYTEREAAHQNLTTLLKTNFACATFIDDALRLASRQSDDVEVRSRVDKLLIVAKECLNPDDDPPAEPVVRPFSGTYRTCHGINLDNDFE